MPPAPPRGPAIDVFNFGGGCCRTCRQHPQGARHRRLQLRWWPLSDMPPAPPGGPPSTSSTSVVATAEPAASTPRGGRHRCLQLRWWLLPDLPPAPPRGPAIDVFNFGGGRCRTCRQHPPGSPPSPSSTSVVASTFLSVECGRSRTSSSGTSRGSVIDVS
jgi:hypothetical protein